MPGFEKYKTILNRLGKYSTGKSCLYIKKMEDVNLDVLKELIEQSVDYMAKANTD
jgi:archaellum biogenesis ATPase FlaH